MIPRSWTPVTRPTDGEIVGYLAPAGRDVVPLSLVGLPLGKAQDASSAGALVVHRGLRALDRRWWCRLPAELAPGTLPAQPPSPDWIWRAVVLVEVFPAGCVVRLDMAPPAELRARVRLPVPVGALLREHPPEERRQPAPRAPAGGPSAS